MYPKIHVHPRAKSIPPPLGCATCGATALFRGQNQPWLKNATLKHAILGKVFNVPSPEKPRKHDETWKSPMETRGNTSEWRWWISQPLILVLFWGGRAHPIRQSRCKWGYFHWPVSSKTWSLIFANTTKTSIWKLSIGGLGRCFSKPFSGARR